MIQTDIFYSKFLFHDFFIFLEKVRGGLYFRGVFILVIEVLLASFVNNLDKLPLVPRKNALKTKIMLRTRSEGMNHSWDTISSRQSTHWSTYGRKSPKM